MFNNSSLTIASNNLKTVFVLCCLTIIFISIVLMPSSIKAVSSAPTFFRTNSSPYGTPYSEWLKNWWQWWIGIPNDQHPFTNYDSKTCPVHQMGPVWYLPDVEPKGQATHASVQYSCNIPQGKAIFFPLSQASCWLGNPEFKRFSNKLAPNPESDQELKICAIQPQDNTNILYVRVDGTNLDTSKIPRATSNFYNVTVPPDAVKGIFEFGPPGTSRGITNGYSLFLAPLSVGQHTIEFKVVDHLAGPTSEPVIREGKYTVFVK
jgi:hypothetical protein